MLMSFYCKLGLFNAHALIIFVHVYTNVKKLGWNREEQERKRKKKKKRGRKASLVLRSIQNEHMQLPPAEAATSWLYEILCSLAKLTFINRASSISKIVSAALVCYWTRCSISISRMELLSCGNSAVGTQWVH